MKFRLTIISILVVSISVILQSCSEPVEYVEDDTSQTSYTTGSIRFIHSATTMEYLVLDYRDLDTDSYEPFLNSAQYRSQYGYYSFRTGLREFAAFEPNTSFLIAWTSFELEEDKKYSMIAYDYAATLNPGFIVLEDTLASADSAFSFIRFIHLASDLDTIIIKEADISDNLVELNRKEYSNYINLPAQTYRFDVKLKSTNEILLANIYATFLSGVTYTALVSGSVNGMTPGDLNINILRDASIKYITVD